MFHRLKSDPRQLDIFCALLDAVYIDYVGLTFMHVVEWPPDFNYSLGLWVPPAASCEVWANLSMLPTLGHLPWTTHT